MTPLGLAIGVMLYLACPGHVHLPEGFLLPDFGLFGHLCMLLSPLASFVLLCVLLRGVGPVPPFRWD